MTMVEYSKLKSIEHHFVTAVKSGFIKSMQRSEVALMVEYYEKITGKRVPQGNRTCSACVLNMTVKVGEDYLAFKEKLSNRKNKSKDADEELEPEQ